MELGKQRVLVRDKNLEDYKGNWLYWNTAIKILESKREIQKDTCFFMNACQFQDLANDQIYQLLSFLSSDEWKLYCEISITAKSQEPSVPLWGLFFFLAYCWGPAWGTPPMAKVMRKEARHTQRRDRASGVPLEILEHLPPWPEPAYFTTLCSHLHLWLYRGAVPHHLIRRRS